MEAELFQVRKQASLAEIVGDDFGAGREAGFHPGFRAQPLLDRFLRHQTGSHHHRRVRCVGAARDRGDHDGAVPQLVAHAVDREIDVSAALRRGLHLRGDLTAFLLPAHRVG